MQFILGKHMRNPKFVLYVEPPLSQMNYFWGILRTPVAKNILQLCIFVGTVIKFLPHCTQSRKDQTIGQNAI